MRHAVTLLLGALALLVVGCSAGASENPDFAPSPGRSAVEHSPGVRINPILPTPSLAAPSPRRSTPGESRKPGQKDPQVVATKLDAPVGLTVLPDGTALVGERTTGRIVRVQPQPGKPVPTVRTLGGLDAAGDGGLLDLAISPTFAEDSLVYAYVTTRRDNRVVAFTLSGPMTPVLTGIPKGRTGNTARLKFASDGSLYVGTGDAGRPALAARASSLGGKVLHITDIGKPAPGNPIPSSPVYTSGHHVVDGLCAIPKTSSLLEVETGSSTAADDEVNVLAKGDYYGWPTATGTAHAAARTLPTTDRAPGGCAVLNNRIWIGSLDGSSLVSAPLAGSTAKLTVGRFAAVLMNTYGRLRTVVAAPDGALWLTTSNRDGKGKPVADDERVIRYLPSPSGGAANPA